MKKLLWSIFILITLLVLFGITSCIDGGDQERPGIKIDSELVVAKIWSISFFEDNGVDQTSAFADVYLEFQPNFRLAVINGCESYEGEWILSSDSTLLVIRMPGAIAPLDQLNDEWVITRLTDTELRIIEQDDKGDEEFHFATAPLRALSCESCNDFTNTATDSVWSVTVFKSVQANQTDELQGSFLRFNPEGTFVFETDAVVYLGDWAVTDNCQRLVLEWADLPPSTASFQELDREWFIDSYDLESMKFSAVDESGYELQLSKGRFPQCTEEAVALHNSSWFIHKVIINSDDVSDQFVGTGFTFLPNNQLATEVIVGPAVLGSWMFAGECDQFVIDSRLESLQELNRTWYIVEQTPNLITLVFEENTLNIELQLKVGIPVVLPWCNARINTMLDGTWKIAEFTDDGADIAADFEEYKFVFNSDGGLDLAYGNQSSEGSWELLRGCRVLGLSVGDADPLSQLNGHWNIEHTKNYEVKLILTTGDQVKELVLVQY